jgi:hypothetical protein
MSFQLIAYDPNGSPSAVGLVDRVAEIYSIYNEY